MDSVGAFSHTHELNLAEDGSGAGVMVCFWVWVLLLRLCLAGSLQLAWKSLRISG